MNVMQIAPDYIRDERDFLTPLTAAQRFRRVLTPQAALAPMAYPTTWMPAIDISGVGQTKAIAAAFPQLFAAGWKLVIMRASIGLTPDALFDYFWRAAKDAGLYLMTYHFGYTAYSGISQASLYLKTIDPMLVAVDGHSAAVLDVEAPGDVTAWRNTVTNFHATTKLKLVTGDYSSVSKWLSCTNNMPVPGFAWNASWSNLVDVPSFAPAIQTVLRQVGVYLKHAWVPKPPGVNEDVDVDYFMGTEEQLRKFLGYDAVPPVPPVPPPPPSDWQTALENLRISLQGQINELKTNDANLLNQLSEVFRRLGILEGKPSGNVPYVWFVPEGGSCVIQYAKDWYKTSSGLDKAIFLPYEKGAHPKVTNRVKVFPIPVQGDGGQYCFILLEQLPDNTQTFYVRRQDGKLES